MPSRPKISNQPTAADRERFGRWVSARRGFLKLTQGGLDAAGGPSEVTVRKIEGFTWTGWGRGDSTFSALDTGLKVRPGTARSVLFDGLDPDIADTWEPPRNLGEVAIAQPAQNLEDHELVGELLRRLAERQELRRQVADLIAAGTTVEVDNVRPIRPEQSDLDRWLDQGAAFADPGAQRPGDVAAADAAAEHDEASQETDDTT